MTFFQEITGPLYPLLDWPMSSRPNGGYAFFSGLGGTSLTLAMWHRHNCHQKWCLRVVRHGRTHCKRHESASASPDIGSD